MQPIAHNAEVYACLFRLVACAAQYLTSELIQTGVVITKLLPNSLQVQEVTKQGLPHAKGCLHLLFITGVP